MFLFEPSENIRNLMVSGGSKGKIGKKRVKFTSGLIILLVAGLNQYDI